MCAVADTRWFQQDVIVVAAKQQIDHFFLDRKSIDEFDCARSWLENE